MSVLLRQYRLSLISCHLSVLQEIVWVISASSSSIKICHWYICQCLLFLHCSCLNESSVLYIVASLGNVSVVYYFTTFLSLFRNEMKGRLQKVFHISSLDNLGFGIKSKNFYWYKCSSIHSLHNIFNYDQELTWRCPNVCTTKSQLSSLL